VEQLARLLAQWHSRSRLGPALDAPHAQADGPLGRATKSDPGVMSRARLVAPSALGRTFGPRLVADRRCVGKSNGRYGTKRLQGEPRAGAVGRILLPSPLQNGTRIPDLGPYVLRFGVLGRLG